MILGVGGFLGFSLAKKLKTEHEDIFIHGLDQVKPIYSNKKHSYIDQFRRLDLRDSKSYRIFRKFDFDTVYHFANPTGNIFQLHDKKYSNFVAYSNFLINSNIIKSLGSLKNVEKFFFASDPFNYSVPILKNMNGFEDILYGMGEDIGMKIFVGRLHSVYGKGMAFNPSKSSIVAEIIRQIYLGKRNDARYISVFGDGDQYRSFIHIDDCLNGILSLVESNIEEPVDIHGIGTNSIEDLIGTIMDILQYHVSTMYKESLEYDKTKTKISNPLSKHIEWYPIYNLVHGLYDFCSWFRSFGEKRFNKICR